MHLILAPGLKDVRKADARVFHVDEHMATFKGRIRHVANHDPVRPGQLGDNRCAHDDAPGFLYLPYKGG
jgi:hypothetical protein